MILQEIILQQNKFNRAFKNEARAGRILCHANSVLSFAAAIPAMFCVLATVFCFIDTLPSTYHHPDSFERPMDMKDTLWFACASIIFILSYRFIFNNPFNKKEPDTISVRFTYWWQLALLCSISLFLLIGTFKMFYFTVLFEPLSMPLGGRILMRAIILFSYSPIIIFVLALFGMYNNINQNGGKNFFQY
jgi:hypothetical protein